MNVRNDIPMSALSSGVEFVNGDFAPRTLYQKLNISETATADQVKDAFRRGEAVTHPDNCSEEKFKDGRAYARLKRAYEILANQRTRQAYDRELKLYRQGPTPKPEPTSSFTNEVTASAPPRSTSGPRIDPVYAYYRLGILVTDGSGSMNEAGHDGILKRSHVNEAVQALLANLSDHEKNHNSAFSLAFVYFNEDAHRTVPRRISEFVANENFDPVFHTGGGGTRIDKALSAAYSVAQDFLNAPCPFPKAVPSATIIVLSDGMCNASDITRNIAEKIRTTRLIRYGDKIVPGISIKSAYFEGEEDDEEQAQAAQELMLDITGGNTHFYKRVQDADALVKFYLHSLLR